MNSRNRPLFPVARRESDASVTARRSVLTVLRHCAPKVLSLGLACLLIASAHSALAQNATPKIYGQTVGNWGHSW